MATRPTVGVVGSEDPEDIRNARELGRLLASEGWVVLSGGRDSGVMKAVNEGAKEANGLTIGILPTADSAVAPGVDVAIFTDLNNARNNLIVLSSRVVVACGVGGSGTASEVALALKNRKPVILLAASEVATRFFQSLKKDAGRVFTADRPADVISIIQREGFC